jgi:CO/xanthine dehydrogenase FAD-binding subunit
MPVRAFEYCAPTSIAEAVALLADKGKRARPLAGGTDLLVRLRYGLLEADTVVDIKRIPETNELRYDPQKGLTIGAAVPCCRLYEDAQIAATYPGLMDAVTMIGGVAIQGRATVGGNLCNAAPSGDAIPPLIVYGASCRIAGCSGERTVPVESFCTAPGRTVLAPGEMLVSIHVPAPKPRMGARYLRFIPRGEMDIAVVGVGASLVLSDDGRLIEAARVALGAVASTPLLVGAAGAALVGQQPSEGAWDKAAALAREAAKPIDDVRGEIAQRRHLVGVLTRRALHGAYSRAKGGA